MDNFLATHGPHCCKYASDAEKESKSSFATKSTFGMDGFLIDQHSIGYIVPEIHFDMQIRWRISVVMIYMLV